MGGNYLFGIDLVVGRIRVITFRNLARAVYYDDGVM